MAGENLKLHRGDYNKPVACNVCGGHMVFKGVGEYQCEKCGNLDYDDYGKVRAYIETHPDQSQMAMIEEHTGVQRKIIRQMLREERLEVAADSSVFIQCEICRKSIRSGRYCPECAKKIHAKEELERIEKEKKQKKLQGFGHRREEQEGEKRFRRER